MTDVFDVPNLITRRLAHETCTSLLAQGQTATLATESPWPPSLHVNPTVRRLAPVTSFICSSPIDTATVSAGIKTTANNDITRAPTGISGNVSMDENGDRNADYSLLDMDPTTGIFQVSAA